MEIARYKLHRQKLLLTFMAFVMLTQIKGFWGLECFFGLGNSSEKNKQKTTECHGDNMVCKKMFGGGMGDQIRRYCEDVSPDVYKALKEKEQRKLNGTIKGIRDIECYDTVDHGRDATICECTTDLCNAADTIYNNNVIKNIKMYVILLFISILNSKHILKERGYT